MDALVLLREAFTQERPIRLIAAPGKKVFDVGAEPEAPSLKEATHLAFVTDGKETAVPKTTPTRFRTGSGQPFALQALYFVYVRREGTFAEYIRDASIAGVPFVSVAERKAAIEYLGGATDHFHGEDMPLDDAEEAPADGKKRKRDDAAAQRKRAPLVPQPENQADYDAMHQVLVSAAGPIVRHAERTTRALSQFAPTSQTVLHGKTTVDLSSAGALLDAWRSRGVSYSGKSAAAAAPKRARRNPIILLSPSTAAMVNLSNVKALLEGAHFEPPHSREENADIVTLEHRKGGAAQKFYAVSSVEALAKLGNIDEVWDRVACVVTTGQEWQFRSYKWMLPRDLFQHTKGFYFQYTNMPVDARVAQWNVSVVRIDPVKRYTDKAAVAGFWRELDKWIAAHKPYLYH